MKRTIPSKAPEAAKTIAPREPKPEPARGLLPSGSTLLNLALSDNHKGGIGAGKVINIVGDSSSGKTLLALTMLAEIAHNSKYDDYTLILDDVEQANEFGLERLFGRATASRVEPPFKNSDGEPVYSETVEQFFANIQRLIRDGEKFVYILDSLDALTDAAEYELADDLVKQADKAAKNDYDDGPPDINMQGSYGMNKAKMMSQLLRVITSGLANSSSVLVIISQTRDAVGARPGQETKRIAGGRALKFYCASVIWLSVVKTIKGGKKEAQQIIGHEIEAKVKKNKLTGKLRAINFCTYDSYGVDDVGSCIDYLIDQDVLKRKGGRYEATALRLTDSKTFTRAELIGFCEQDAEFWKETRRLVAKAWQDQEEALDLGRKPRFG